MPKLLIAASGTGGHLFPGLAVAEAMPPSWEISWLGVPDRLEVKVLPKCYQLVTVSAGAVQAKGIRRFLQIFQLLIAAKKVNEFNQLNGIDVVFTTGGYIAAPAILGAIWSGLPVVLHESNAFPGRVTRLMGRFCNLIALGLPPAAKHISGCKKVVVTGTPVRTPFLSLQSLPSWVPIGPGPLIVVIGGWKYKPDLFNSNIFKTTNEVSNTHSLGQVLYTDYIHIFQISGMILLIAMIGAIVLTFRQREGVKKQSYIKQISRERSDGVELLEVQNNKGVKIND